MPIHFGIIGGDARQIYLAKSLKQDGHTVYLSGLEKAPGTEGFEHVPPEELGVLCEAVVLPLPVTKDGKTLNAPFAGAPVEIGERFARSLSGCKVLGGMTQRLPRLIAWETLAPIDYYTRDELVAGNAVLTAEAALGLAIQEFPGALNGARCLVTGFGRIGKSLCGMLRALAAEVDCAARKKLDFMMIQNMGCQPVVYPEIRERYDIIFNTVPATVLSEQQLAFQDQDTILIELASAPGGIDLQAAAKYGVRVVDGQSLPGRVSPKTAGEYIKQTICNILEE